MPAYIVENRVIVEAVKAAAHKLGIEYTATEGDWIMQLRKSGITRCIYLYNFDCNPHASASIVSDKPATYDILTMHHIPAVPHFTVKSVLSEAYDTSVVDRLFSEYGDVVIKPLHGSRGRSIAKADRTSEAINFMDGEEERLWAIAPFVDIDYEVRIVVHAGEAVFAYKKYDGPIINRLRMFNLNLGAKSLPMGINELPAALVEMAIKAARVTNMRLCAVDIVVQKDGAFRVLEINGGFSLEHFVQNNPESRQDVIALYEAVVEDMFGGV